MKNKYSGGYNPFDSIDDYGDRYGGFMEVSAYCNRFERKYDFDVFSMSDYQSCENCRHFGPEDRCLIRDR